MILRGKIIPLNIQLCTVYHLNTVSLRKSTGMDESLHNKFKVGRSLKNYILQLWLCKRSAYDIIDTKNCKYWVSCEKRNPFNIHLRVCG